MWNLMKKDGKILIQNKRIWMFMAAVLIVLLVSTAFHATREPSEEGTGLSIGLIDLDHTTYSKLMISYFEESEVFEDYVSITVGTLDEIMEQFERGELSMVLEIPKDFAENLINIENVPMKANISMADTTNAIILKNMLLGYERYISAVEVNCVSLYDLMEQAGIPEEKIDSENELISFELVFTALGRSDFFDMMELEKVSRVSILPYYGFEVLFLLLSYLAVFTGMDLLNEQKNGVMSRLITTNTKVTTLLAEKLLMHTIPLSLGLGFFYVLGRWKVVPSLSFVGMVFCILYFAVASVFFLMLGVCFRKIPTYLLVSNLIIVFFAILGAGFIPLQFLPTDMRQLAALSPNYWFLDYIISLHMGARTLSIAGIAASLAGIVGLTFAIGALYRRKEGIVREDI